MRKHGLQSIERCNGEEEKRPKCPRLLQWWFRRCRGNRRLQDRCDRGRQERDVEVCWALSYSPSRLALSCESLLIGSALIGSASLDSQKCGCIISSKEQLQAHNWLTYTISPFLRKSKTLKKPWFSRGFTHIFDYQMEVFDSGMGFESFSNGVWAPSPTVSCATRSQPH